MFTSFIRSILKYSIFSDAIVKDMVSLIFLSVSLLLVCRNAIDFQVMILYPAILLNWVIKSVSLLVELLEGFL